MVEVGLVIVPSDELRRLISTENLYSTGYCPPNLSPIGFSFGLSGSEVRVPQISIDEGRLVIVTNSRDHPVT